jgi:hypothetical protein
VAFRLVVIFDINGVYAQTPTKIIQNLTESEISCSLKKQDKLGCSQKQLVSEQITL